MRLNLALAACLLAAPALAAEETLMTGPEIAAAITGNTVEGSMADSGRYSEFYAADGTIKAADYEGAWTVEGDAMCFQYGETAPDCWQVGRAGDEILWVKEGEVLGSGTLRTGNPNGY